MEMNSPWRSRQRVLHVDDDTTFTRLVGDRLAQRGIETVICNDPLDWEKCFATCRPAAESGRCDPPAPVLLDIEMPGKGGLEILREIQAMDPLVPVIMVTGVSAFSEVLTALQLGADRCFFKPLADVDALARAIREFGVSGQSIRSINTADLATIHTAAH